MKNLSQRTSRPAAVCRPRPSTTHLPGIFPLLLLITALSLAAPVRAGTTEPSEAAPSAPSGAPTLSAVPPPGGDMGRLAARLGLTDEQREEIGALRRAFLEETSELRNEIRRKRLELSGLMHDPEVGNDELSAAQKELIAMRAQMMEKAAAFHLQVRNVLTPEQVRRLPPWFGCAMGGPHGPHGPGRKRPHRHGPPR